MRSHTFLRFSEFVRLALLTFFGLSAQRNLFYQHERSRIDVLASFKAHGLNGDLLLSETNRKTDVRSESDESRLVVAQTCWLRKRCMLNQFRPSVEVKCGANGG